MGYIWIRNLQNKKGFEDTKTKRPMFGMDRNKSPAPSPHGFTTELVIKEEHVEFLNKFYDDGINFSIVILVPKERLLS